jgi:hypothetical protein
VRHDARVVDDDVDAPVCVHSPIDNADDLLVLRHVGLHDGLVAERQFIGQRVEPVEAPRANTTRAPSAANRRAVAAPFPLLAPVMTTTLSLIPRTMIPDIGAATSARGAGIPPPPDIRAR